MIRLDKSLAAWGTPKFNSVLKQELALIGIDYQLLHQSLSSGNHVAEVPITVVINAVAEMEHVIRITAGIFYKGVMGGCSCADDPGALAETNEYCEVQLDIDKETAAAKVVLLVE